MPTNPTIFKAYDIRGIYGADLDERTAFNLGIAFSEMRKKELNKENVTVVVARDMRLSSPQLATSLINGLEANGATVVNIGLASTPTFYFAVADGNYDGGIIVSASHNPAPYNGFKVVRHRSIPVSGETGMMTLRDEVLKLENENTIDVAKTTPEKTEEENVLADQIMHDLTFADIEKINPFKIVADPANSMGAQYLEAVFDHLPCTLVKMNWELDGSFPNHEADPLKDENLADLQKRVLDEKADFGIATDGDGDRVFFVDNEGELISQAIIRGLLAKIFLAEKPGTKVCYDIRPGRITRDLIEENGGTPILTRVGHSLIKEQTVKEGAYFAGENSGHFFLNLEIGCFEVPVIVILKLLEYFSTEINAGRAATIADIIRPYKKYFHSGEINSTVADKDAVIAALIEKYADGELNKLDGITIEYPDFWFNVRGSNTEPKLRLNLEARTKEIMEAKRDEVLGIIRG